MGQEKIQWNNNFFKIYFEIAELPRNDFRAKNLIKFVAFKCE